MKVLIAWLKKAPVQLAALVLIAGWGIGAGPAQAACTVPNTLTNGSTADASQVMGNFNAVTNCINGGVANPLVMGFFLGNGSVGTNVGPILIAARAGTFSKCKVVIKTSDASTGMTFRINQNGTNIFSSTPSIAPGTASGTVLTFTTLTSSPLSVAADDLFTIDVTSGTAFWQVTIQLE
ncbi:hypothetical protein [Phenylobacterium sp.]|uniref:hypothetical protein n=1 Tax=Phenylobacterium sp. TaxID=1871053 RepID=UPI002FCC3F1F